MKKKFSDFQSNVLKFNQLKKVKGGDDIIIEADITEI